MKPADEHDLNSWILSGLHDDEEELLEWKHDSCDMDVDCLEHRLSGDQGANVIAPGTLAYVADVRMTDTRSGESRVKQAVLHPRCADALLQGQKSHIIICAWRGGEIS